MCKFTKFAFIPLFLTSIVGGYASIDRPDNGRASDDRVCGWVQDNSPSPYAGGHTWNDGRPMTDAQYDHIREVAMGGS